MVYDFHTHSSLSDGELSPLELVRRAFAAGYRAIAITDHCGPGEMRRLIRELLETCALARAQWNILAVAGVELTHVPAAALVDVARQAKELGAQLVVVHGETIVEPVEKGTNWAALQSPHVDILAHPGLLSQEEAKLSAHRGIFLELSARRGHCLTNGHVAQVAREEGARLLLSSDAHGPEDLLSPTLARNILLGSAISPEAEEETLKNNPLALLRRLGLGRGA